MLIHGKPGFRNGHELYLYASVTIIYARQNGGIFNSAGKVVGYVSTRGKWAFSVTLSQGTDARWRIGSMVRLHPVHGLGSASAMTPSRCSLAVARAAACLAVLSGVGALVLVSALSPPVAYGVGSVTTTTTLGGCVLVPVGVACGVGAGGSSSTTTPVSTTTPSLARSIYDGFLLCLSGHTRTRGDRRRKLRVQPERPAGALLDERSFTAIPFMGRVDASIWVAGWFQRPVPSPRDQHADTGPNLAGYPVQRPAASDHNTSATDT